MIDVLFSETALGSLGASQKNPQDIFAFDLSLSMGDISKDNFFTNRQKMRRLLLNPHSVAPVPMSSDVPGRLQKNLNTISQRILRGEDLRIWYSTNPDELCGLYWFMAQLAQLEGHLGTVSVIKLPEYEYDRHSDTIVSHVSWKEVCGGWQNYMALAEPTPFVFRLSCVMKWHDLQQENAPLRIYLNGQLISAPETLYDYLIDSEIQKESGEFCEAAVIGNLVGLQLGVPDGWFALLIEKMIENGRLSVVEDGANGSSASGAGVRRLLRRP